jgi:hypothetical protein
MIVRWAFFWSLLVLQIVPSAAQSITIKVLEGDAAINNIRSQRAKEPVVRVEDEAGEPVVGAAVHFLAPTTGPGGVFLFGRPTHTTVTDRDGRASAPGFRPNKSVGQFEIRVTASYSGQTAAAKVTQTNAEPATATGMSSKTIAILAIVGGAVAGGAAIAARGGGKSAPGSTSVASGASGAVISPGNPSLGAP